MATLVSHGAHNHKLTVTSNFSLFRTNILTCSVCTAPIVIETRDPTCARLVRYCQCCNFFLCQKCFEIDEQPLSFSQHVIRNPSIPDSDKSVCVRTRPRTSAHVLCPLYPAKMMEVVAYYEAKEEGVAYFRMKCGGWIPMASVVCILPSDTSIAALARLHIQFDTHSSADLLPFAELLSTIEEAEFLLKTTPEYSAVLAYFALLPLQLYVSNQAATLAPHTPKELASITISFLVSCLKYAVPVLQLHDMKTFSVSNSLMIRLIGRCLSVAWHLRCHRGEYLSNEGTDLVFLAIQTLAKFVCHARVGPEPENSTDPIRSLWLSVWHHNVRLDIVEGELGRLCVHLCDVALKILNDNPRSKENITDLFPIRQVLTAAPGLVSSGLKSEFWNAVIGIASRTAEAQVPAMQWAMFDMDVLELGVGALRGQDHSLAIVACQTLALMFRENEEIISMTCEIIVPPLLYSLRASLSSSLTNALLNLCETIGCVCGTSKENIDFLSSMNCCTAQLHPGCAISQPITVMRSQALGVIGLCQFCAKNCNVEGEVLSAKPQHYIYVCQCRFCLEREPIELCIPPPCAAPSKGLRCLEKHGLIPSLVGKITLVREEAVNHVARVALRLQCSTEELAVAVLKVLLNKPRSALMSCFYDASMFVASCRFFPEVRRQIDLSGDCDLKNYALGLMPQDDSLGSRSLAAEATPNRRTLAAECGLTPEGGLLSSPKELTWS